MQITDVDGALSPVNLEVKLVSLGDGMGALDAVLVLSSRHGRKDG